MKPNPMTIDPRLQQIVAAQPYPLAFATISGAHLYGFPSPDSDYDLRGAHMLSVAKLFALKEGDETVQDARIIDGLDMDIVSHDVKKFFLLLLKKNGYVLEQLYSPLVVHTTPWHEELKQITLGCITRHHAHHYLGFAETQWRLFSKENPLRVKPLLYVYRVLLTGIWLMRSGQLEANLVVLNDEFKLPQIRDLIARKLAGPEQSTINDADIAFYEAEYKRLSFMLETTRDANPAHLPETPSNETYMALDDLLVRIRLAS